MYRLINPKANRILLGIVSALFCMSSVASDLNQVQSVGERKLKEAEQSQAKIDKIVDGAQERIIKYRALLKQIEGLQAYNKQLATQVEGQSDLIERFDASINQVSLIERQMSPLVSKMAGSLDEFIGLDLPFNTAERQERMAFINENIQAADVDVSEKFRQVIEAYQIENEYGRKIDTYNDIINVNGEELEVDVLRVGRVAMLFQTKDTKTSGRWDNDTKSWQVLDSGSYRNSIKNGIKMAKKQASIDILVLPIPAPQEAK